MRERDELFILFTPSWVKRGLGGVTLIPSQKQSYFFIK
jgi:hypothetical protein